MTLPQNILVRKARVADVPIIGEIVNKQAETGIMLQRPLSRIYDNVRDYTVVESDGEIVGCGSLHVMWSDLAEVCAVALRKGFKGRGFGRAIVESLLEEAKTLGIDRVFVLTYQADFFKHLGFSVIEKSELPHKIWNDCINCVHFPNCDEIALVRIINPDLS